MRHREKHSACCLEEVIDERGFTEEDATCVTVEYTVKQNL